MEKKVITLFFAIVLVIGLGTFVNAQSLEGMSSVLGFKDLLYADWQTDYILPIEPGEMEKGDYRITGNIGRFSFENIYYDYDYNPDEKTKDDNYFMNYLVGFDTALSDDLYLHAALDIVPWQEYGETTGDEMKMNLFNLFLDYKYKDDKTFYVGYNRVKSDDKSYNIDGDLSERDEYTNNIFFVGFEMKGSFNKNTN